MEESLFIATCIEHRHFYAAKVNPHLTLCIKLFIIDEVYRITFYEPHFAIFTNSLAAKPCEIILSACCQDPLNASCPAERCVVLEPALLGSRNSKVNNTKFLPKDKRFSTVSLNPDFKWVSPRLRMQFL